MTPSSARDPRYHSLDVWRGLIALWVVLEHASVVLQVAPEGGAGAEAWADLWLIQPLRLCLGAPLFFVISGYCVAASAEASRSRGTSAAAMLTRRFRRIVPTYWAALLVFVALVAVLDLAGLEHWHRRGWGLELASPRELDLGQWVGNLTLTETWRPRVWGGGGASVYTGVAWSLCYQEQFFVVCALTLLVAPRRLYGVLTAVTLAVLAVRAFAIDVGAMHRIEGTFLDRWHEFAVGLAVYWRLNVARTPIARRGVEVGLGIMLALALWAGPVSTAATAAFGLGLIGLRPWDARTKGLALLAPLRACGRRSYSLYLIHVPVCSLVGAAMRQRGFTSFWEEATLTAPMMVGASIGASWLFYRYVEKHFTEPLTTRPEPARSPALGTLAMA